MNKETIEHILNILRQGTITWKGRSECLGRHRVQVQEGVLKSGPNKGKPKLKWHWVCAKCSRKYRDESSMEVDHIVEIGPFLGNFDKHIKRMYCEQSNLQALCLICHKRKTAAYTSAVFRYKRKEK